MESQCLTGPVARSQTCSLLQVHLLGCVPFEDVLSLQRRLVHQVANDRDRTALIVCEHPPVITVGRLGSRTHIHIEHDELRLRGWQVRWVNRGGGCVFHMPGQLALYPIIPLDRLGCNLQEYLNRLASIVLEIMTEYMIRGTVDVGSGQILASGRPVATLGMAVRRWVTYHGVYLNVHPNLDLLRRVRTAGGTVPMTSLERERHAPVAMQRVRERAIELVAEQFACTETAVFFDHARRI
jgi:lipoyl(octanoyl) transferase